MTEMNTKLVRIFTTDSEEMANEIRHFPVFVMNREALQATELSDDARLALITAIHMQQDVLAESIVELSHQENNLLGGDSASRANLAEVQATLKWCVEQANLLDDARRQLGDLWEQDAEFDTKMHRQTLDYCSTHDGKCDPDYVSLSYVPEGHYRDDDGTIHKQHDVFGGPHDEPEDKS
jgi:hypothetical protein